MWLNERARQTGGAGYECAGVTLGAVRWKRWPLPFAGDPGVCPLRLCGQCACRCQVLLLSGGEDGAVVAGARMGSIDLAPGEVELRGPAAGWCACAGTVRCG